MLKRAETFFKFNILIKNSLMGLLASFKIQLKKKLFPKKTHKFNLNPVFTKYS